MRSHRGGSVGAFSATASSRANISIDGGRSAGAFASARSTTRSIGGGILRPLATVLGGLGATSTCWCIQPIGVSESNGVRPASTSHSTMPVEKMSDRRSSFWPSSCSGLM
jgi:hypothetical protein